MNTNHPIATAETSFENSSSARRMFIGSLSGVFLEYFATFAATSMVTEQCVWLVFCRQHRSNVAGVEIFIRSGLRHCDCERQRVGSNPDGDCLVNPLWIASVAGSLAMTKTADSQNLFLVYIEFSSI